MREGRECDALIVHTVLIVYIVYTVHPFVYTYVLPVLSYFVHSKNDIEGGEKGQTIINQTLKRNYGCIFEVRNSDITVRGGRQRSE